MGPAEVLVPIAFFLSIASIFVLRGPLGKALADRIAGRVGGGDVPQHEHEQLLAELDDVKHRLAELEERLDFAERMLARQKYGAVLPPGAQR